MDNLTQQQANILALFVMNDPDTEYTTEEKDTGHHGLILYTLETDTDLLPIHVPEGRGEVIVSFLTEEHSELENVNPECFDFDYYYD